MGMVGEMGMMVFSSSPVLTTAHGSQQCSWRDLLGHKERDLLPWFVFTAPLPRTLLSPLVSVPLKGAGYIHLTTPCLSHLYIYLFCAHQNSRIKNISAIFPHQ